MTDKKETIKTKIWKEIPEKDNPFGAAVCYCHGYDVYGDVLSKANWVEYLYLLFAGERPTPEKSELLEKLAIAIANPGPRDHSVRAAMNAGVGGSTYASCLMAALAVGAGQYGGAHEVAIAMDYWLTCQQDLSAWKSKLIEPELPERADIWQPMEHPPGFDPHGASCTTPVRQTLDCLAKISPGNYLPWLKQNRVSLEAFAECPLTLSGVAAAVFMDLGLSADQGEMLFLMLRLPGAAVHALEQEKQGWRNYPFFTNAIDLQNDPAKSTTIKNQSNKKQEKETLV